VLRYLSVVRDSKVESTRAAFFARREKMIEAAQARPAVEAPTEENRE
jgi:hypothetical protein